MTDLERTALAPAHPAERGEFPWWLLIVLGFVATMFFSIMARVSYSEAFAFVRAGIGLTVTVSLVAFGIALVIGLIAGLGRISSNPFARHLAIAYIEFIRGIPMIVLIITVALVLVPVGVELLAGLGLGIDIRSVSMSVRAIIALSAIYGGYLAEIFRAGVESVPPGQSEAARSLGMTKRQTMRRIVLPQAVRNMLPAIGNDFIAMLKDSSLISVLAVREVTQLARLYAGASFQFAEAYLVLTFLYLTMTLTLSLLMRLVERRMAS